VTVLPALCRAWRASAGRGQVTGWRTGKPTAPEAAAGGRPRLPSAAVVVPRPVPATVAAAPPSQIRPISTKFDAARWPASAEETERAARRRRWRGDPAARAAGSGDAGVGPLGVHPKPSGRVAAATLHWRLQRLVGSLTESLGNLGPKLRIDGGVMAPYHGGEMYAQ